MQKWVTKVISKIEKIALNIEGVDKQCAYHNSYFFEAQCLFYLKVKDDIITIGCHKGYLLEDMFDFTKSGKYMRHLYIKKEEDFNEEIIKSYINEAVICSIELNEKNKMKQALKRGLKNGYSSSN